jgi:hypothetical protein
MALNLPAVMCSIYECEENCSLGSDWDGGWRVTIGGSQNAVQAEANVASPYEAAKWLHEQAIKLYPEYAKRYGNRVITGRAPTPPPVP